MKTNRKKNHRWPSRGLGLSLAAMAMTGSASAGSPPAGAEAGGKNPPVEAPAAKEESAFDRLWGLATLYKDDSNPFVQEFKLRGRYHGQYHWLDSEQGDDDDWENRRSRFGFDAKLFDRKIEIRIDAQSNDEFDPFYDRLVDAYVKWKPTKSFSLTVGKQKPQIGWYDWLQSSNSMPAFERSQIFNQLRVDRATGAVAEGRVGQFTYQLGGYFNDVDREFGHLDGGTSFGAGIGYDLKSNLDVERADLRFDWLHSGHEPGDTVLNRYDDLFSVSFWLETGPFGFVAEAFGAAGTSPDSIGFLLQPTYDLVPDKLQLVGRYTFANGDGPDSLTAQSRYERAAPSLTGGGRGETYHSGYLGLQYFIYGDKLKLMAGAEYAHLDGGGNGGDFDGWTVLTGIRFYF